MAKNHVTVILNIPPEVQKNIETIANESKAISFALHDKSSTSLDDKVIQLLHAQQENLSNQISIVEYHLIVLSFAASICIVVFAGAAWMWLNGLKREIHSSVKESAKSTAGNIAKKEAESVARKTVEEKWPSIANEMKNRQELGKAAGGIIGTDGGDSTTGRRKKGAPTDGKLI